VADRLAEVADRSTVRMTHYGRRSGRAYEVTIWFAVDGDHLYLATMNAGRQWVRNIARTPGVRLRIGALALRGHVTRLDRPGDLLRAYQLFVAKYWAMWLLDGLAALIGRSPRTTGTVDPGRGAFFRVAIEAGDARRTGRH
jgi:nitroimidazol reductase NimA-like FMN-containing flavoprotein (pyridoxamine 5'-phosphate oxidase superfamily)